MGCSSSVAKAPDEGNGSPVPSRKVASSDDADRCAGDLPPMLLTDAQRNSFKRSRGKVRRTSEATVALEGGVQADFDANWIGLATTHGIDLYSELEDPEFVKINQDRGMVVWPFAGSYGSAMLGLFDGHGQGGERVAEQCCYLMTDLLAKDLQLPTNPMVSLEEKMCQLDELVLKFSSDDCDPYMCGTTATIVYLLGVNVYVAAVGDSRCVLGYIDRAGLLQSHEMTRDHKPSMKGERERLEAAGATVEGVGDRSRMWALHEESDSLCGLNMSRSIGDGFCKQHGVIPVPDVQSFSLHECSPGSNMRDTFLIVASDGIWECVSSDEACGIVRASSGAQLACQALLERAQKGWERKTAAYRDDITVIVVFLPFLHPEWDLQLAKEMEEEQAAATPLSARNSQCGSPRGSIGQGTQGRIDINVGETGMAKLKHDEVPANLRNYAAQASLMEFRRNSELAASFKRSSNEKRRQTAAPQVGRAHKTAQNL
uniref:PPM-type phosphatase domain-containing protein n=1 Tax=Calcidiscus leptoporus TaxID=127549 RepID=A0A7S0IVI9_9EUKA|mmetsp:Transcript_25079/g.58463  ORF Transcript_25079/g.58463 Transcript_25079/m.58463 type:complete len:486 (+) Transcript_25079:166-1623(+)